jgi:uncharacterized integral membrane protein
LTSELDGKAVSMRTTFALYWLVIVSGVLAAILVAVLNA